MAYTGPPRFLSDFDSKLFQPTDEFSMVVEGLRPGTAEIISCRIVNALSTFNLGPYIKNINLTQLATCHPELGGVRLIKRFAAFFCYLSVNIPCRRREILEEMVNQNRSRETTSQPGRRRISPIADKVLILLFNTGKCVVTGAKSYGESVKMAHHFCGMLNSATGMPVVVTDFRICNFVGRCKVPHTINLEDMFEKSMLGTQLKYDPLEFKMIIVRSSSYFDSSLPQEDRNVTALIGRGGAVNITGPKNLEQLVKFMRDIYQHIKYFQPGAGPPPWIRPPIREIGMLGLGYSRTVSFDPIEEAGRNVQLENMISSMTDYGVYEDTSSDSSSSDEDDEVSVVNKPGISKKSDDTLPKEGIDQLHEDSIISDFNSLSIETMKDMNQDDLEQMLAHDRNLEDFLSNLNIGELHNPDQSSA